jgi:hypothetical protein
MDEAMGRAPAVRRAETHGMGRQVVGTGGRGGEAGGATVGVGWTFLLCVLGSLAQAPGRGCAQVVPATHLSCYDDGSGVGCVPCGVLQYQDEPDHDEPCKTCSSGSTLEWNAQPSTAIGPNADTVAMVLSDREIVVGALAAGYSEGDTVSIMNDGGGCDNGAAGVYKIESIDLGRNAVVLTTSSGAAWPSGVDWSADPSNAAHCTLERPGPGYTACYPCGGFVAWDADPDDFLASANMLDKPYIGMTDLDQNPRTPCTPCTVRGTYAPLGHHMAGQSANRCIDCESGKTDGDNDPRTECEPCEAGTYAPEGAACEYCARGMYDDDLDPATPCQSCAAGKVAVVEKSTVCTDCEAGQYTDDNRWMCLDCPPGKFSQPGEGLCLNCMAGRYSIVVASAECLFCPIGMYNDMAGSTFCTECPVGTYNDMDGSAVCTDCPTGQLTETAGSVACTDVPGPPGEGPIDCSAVDTALPCNVMMLVDEVQGALALSDVDPEVFCPCKLVRDGALDWSPEVVDSCSGPP